MRSGVKVFAWRRIRAGEEITVDYRLNAYDDNETWICLCGSEGCGGVVVGSFFSLSPETQRTYLRYAPMFIRVEYRRRIASQDPKV